MTTTTYAPFAVNNFVRVVKGCRDRGVLKGHSYRIESMTPVDHGVKITLRISPTSTQSWYLRFAKHLTNHTIRLNDGNPLHTIEVTRR